MSGSRRLSQLTPPSEAEDACDAQPPSANAEIERRCGDIVKPSRRTCRRAVIARVHLGRDRVPERRCYSAPRLSSFGQVRSAPAGETFAERQANLDATDTSKRDRRGARAVSKTRGFAYVVTLDCVARVEGENGDTGAGRKSDAWRGGLDYAQIGCRQSRNAIRAG